MRSAGRGSWGIMKQARRLNDNALAGRLRLAFALATGSLIPGAPAGAQTPAASACVTAACTSAPQSQLSTLLSPFPSLVGTTAFSPRLAREAGAERPGGLEL